MLPYCLNREKNTESKNNKATRSRNKNIMLSSKWAVCDSKKSKFIKQQEVSGLLTNLGIETPWSRIPIEGFLLF